MLKTQVKKIIDMDVADIASLPALKRHGASLLRFSNCAFGCAWIFCFHKLSGF